jgi:hypothetical protein
VKAEAVCRGGVSVGVGGLRAHVPCSAKGGRTAQPPTATTTSRSS